MNFLTPYCVAALVGDDWRWTIVGNAFFLTRARGRLAGTACSQRGKDEATCKGANGHAQSMLELEGSGQISGDAVTSTRVCTIASLSHPSPDIDQLQPVA